jgi:hypothetical protein
MRDRTNERDGADPVDAPLGDEDMREGGKAAAGDATGTRGQLDSASGGYGSQSGSGSSGGTGEGEPVSGGSHGAEEAGLDPETAWLREEASGQPKAR